MKQIFEISTSNLEHNLVWHGFDFIEILEGNIFDKIIYIK